MIIQSPTVQRIPVDLKGRITLMLLEFDNAELLQMLEDHDSLKGRVEEAVAVLRPHLVYEGVSRVSVSCQTAFDEEASEEAAELGKTAGAEGAAERSARMRAALGANVRRSPVVLAALRRVAQAQAASEAAKDESKSVTEVQKEEDLPVASISRSHDRVAECGPFAKVNHPSSQTSSSYVNFSSLKHCFPMCGPTPMPRVRFSPNPAAEVFVPRPPGYFDWGLAWEQSSLQQVCYPLQAWLQQLGHPGVEPWLCTPWIGAALGMG